MEGKRQRRKRPGRNDPCPCGSGLKQKRCRHENSVPFDVGPLKGATAKLWLDRSRLDLPPGVTVSVKADALFQYAEECPMPPWYLGLALEAARRCGTPTATHADTLSTILLTTLAAEATVNRLLEQLVAAKDCLERQVADKDWDKIEKKAPATKWVKLSELLRMKPTLRADAEPLRSLDALFQLRNDLVHFKFGRNLTVAKRQLDAEHDGTTSVIRFPESDTVYLPIERQSQLPAALDPKKGWGYFESFVNVLTPVLSRFPEEPFGIRRALMEALERMGEDNQAATERTGTSGVVGPTGQPG